MNVPLGSFTQTLFFNDNNKLIQRLDGDVVTCCPFYTFVLLVNNSSLIKNSKCNIIKRVTNEHYIIISM